MFVWGVCTDEPKGLIRGRIAGADAAVSTNLFFLDAHCKPRKNWEYPLLQHLKTNYRRVACPVIFVSINILIYKYINT